MRIRLALRNRAFFFFSLGMPLIFLFGAVLLVGKDESSWIGYILGAILTMTVMGSFWALSVQLVTFREQGILRRFRIAPVGAGAILASSILANYFLVIPTVIVEMLTCRWAFHLHSWGNLWAIFVLVTIGSATFSSFGLIVASVTNTMQETQMINNLIWMSFIFLSGATIPLAVFPAWIQRVVVFVPATYLATGLEMAAAQFATTGQILEDMLASRSQFRANFSAGSRNRKFRARPSFGCWLPLCLFFCLEPGRTFGELSFSGFIKPTS